MNPDFSADVMEPYLNETFVFAWPDGREDEATLIEVLRLSPPKQKAYSWQKVETMPNVRLKPFSMVFRLVADPDFPQSMCTVRHDKLEDVLPENFFVVLIDKGDDGELYYEALFN